MSNPLVSTIWTLLQTASILSWQGINWMKSEYKNVFHFQLCGAIYLSNILLGVAYLSFFQIKMRKILLVLRYGTILPMIFHTIAILFGSPIFRQFDCTLSFALLITALILPSVIVSIETNEKLTLSSLTWLRGSERWTLIGAWAGAFVIPLDWDRPWQVWPEPCCLGAVVGCYLHSMITLIRAKLNSTGFQVYWRNQFFIHEGRV